MAFQTPSCMPPRPAAIERPPSGTPPNRRPLQFKRRMSCGGLVGENSSSYGTIAWNIAVRLWCDCLDDAVFLCIASEVVLG